MKQRHHPAPRSLMRLLKEAEYELVGDHLRDPGEEWHVRCTRCQAEVWLMATSLRWSRSRRQGAARTRCSHRPKRIIVPPKTVPTQGAAGQALRQIIGLCLREARQQHKMTQKQFCAHIGLTQSSVSAIERGVKNVLLDTFLRSCAVLETRPTDMVARITQLAADVPRETSPSNGGQMTTRPVNYNELNRIAGLCLKAARQGAGMSQQDLGKHLEMSHPCLGAIESGKNRMRLDTLLSACAALNVDPADMVTRIAHLYAQCST